MYNITQSNNSNEKSMWKTMREQKGLKTQFWAIFDRFGSHLGPPKRSQDVEKSMLKWHQNWFSFGRPLGTRFFRSKRRQDALAPQIAAEDGVGPSLLGEDLGGGRQTFKLQDELMSGTWLWKGLEGQEDLDRIVQHAVPVGRRIGGLRLGTAAPVY